MQHARKWGGESKKVKGREEGEAGGVPSACWSLTVSGNAAGAHAALVALHQSHAGATVSKLPRVDVPYFYVFIPGAGAQEVATKGEAAV